MRETENGLHASEEQIYHYLANAAEGNDDEQVRARDILGARDPKAGM